MELDEPRILICGSRSWPWPDTVAAVLDRLSSRHGNRLVIIEDAATGAARAAHRWSESHRLPAWRHRCYPAASLRGRSLPRYQADGPDRHQRMLLAEEPRLVVAFHHNLATPTGETADTCLRALLRGTPAWLVPTEDPGTGLWLKQEQFPPEHAALLRRQLDRVLRSGAATREGAEPSSRPGVPQR